MDNKEIKLKCLELAVEYSKNAFAQGGSVVEHAKEFVNFVNSTSPKKDNEPA